MSEENLSKRQQEALVSELVEKFEAIIAGIEEDRKAEFFWRLIVGLLAFVFGVLVGTVAP